MVAEHLGTDHTDVQFPTSQAEELLPTLPALSDEPMANPSLLPTILVSRVARNSVVVALSGDGGDELFGGYNRYRLDGTLIRMGRRAPYAIRQLAARGLRGVGASGDVAVFRAALRALGFGSQQSNRERLEKLARVLGARTDQGAYTSLLEVGFPRPPLELARMEEEVLESNPWALRDASLLQRMLMSDQLQYLPGDLLAKVDRASMWESLEVRVPLLDPRVVEFSWGLPDEIKLRKGIGKWPLRELAYRYVPREVIDRPKMGFTVPITGWMGGGLKNWMQDMLLSNESGRVPWDQNTLAGHIVAFDRGRDDLALSLWAAAVLQSWSDSWGVTF
jgi:asparagine synthase (glutamine-hydrolysing)